MKYEEIEVGRIYEAVKNRSHCFEDGELVLVKAKRPTGTHMSATVDVVSVDDRSVMEGAGQTLSVYELRPIEPEPENDMTDLEKFKDIFRELILKEQIQIEATPHGFIRISIDGELVLES